MTSEIPNLFWGTVNVVLPYEIALYKADKTIRQINWTADEPNPVARIAPEDFSFVRCCLAFGGRYYPGFIYYPHPETKPATNAHNYTVLEVLTRKVEGMSYGRPAAILCRLDAFQSRSAAISD